jgi:hypothetical protein
MVSVQVSVALIYNYHPRLQILAVNVVSLAAAAAFYVLLAHDRPFIGAITVSPKPLLQLEEEANRSGAIPPAAGASVGPAAASQ